MSDQPVSFEGLYNDGRSAAVIAVHVRIEADGLLIETLDGTRVAHWPFRALIRHPDDAEGHMRLGLKRGSEGRLAVAGPAPPSRTLFSRGLLISGGGAAFARLCVSPLASPF